MIVDLPNLEAEIRKISTTYELDRVIDVVKAQQRLLRGLANVSAKGGLRVGDLVKASARGKTIQGRITKIKRTKAIVDTSSGLFNVPLSMLHMVRSAA